MNKEELKSITDIIVKNCEPSKIGEVILSVASFASKSTLNTVKSDELLSFTKQEIMKMPTAFKKEYCAEGFAARIYKRKNSKNAYVYDIKYRRNGYNVCITDSILERAKVRFITALKNATPTIKRDGKVPITFYSFTIYYYENFRKRKISDATYKNDMGRINKYLKPLFHEKLISKITSIECQDLIDGINNEGKGKTADEIFSILSIIFKGAITHNLINKNPLNLVVHTVHDTQHGKALTIEEENYMKEYFKNTAYLNTLMVSLYTGLRPNELKSVEIKGDMIIAINSKRKTKKVEYKRIPICEMLKPYVKNGFKSANIDNLRDKFRLCFKDHKLYDLRTTFYSRCKECGLELYAIEEYMGHSLGAIGNSYTDLSDDYLRKEMKKFNY